MQQRAEYCSFNDFCQIYDPTKIFGKLNLVNNCKKYMEQRIVSEFKVFSSFLESTISFVAEDTPNQNSIEVNLFK